MHQKFLLFAFIWVGLRGEGGRAYLLSPARPDARPDARPGPRESESRTKLGTNVLARRMASRHTQPSRQAPFFYACFDTLWVKIDTRWDIKCE